MAEGPSRELRGSVLAMRRASLVPSRRTYERGIRTVALRWRDRTHGLVKRVREVLRVNDGCVESIAAANGDRSATERAKNDGAHREVVSVGVRRSLEAMAAFVYQRSLIKREGRPTG